MIEKIKQLLNDGKNVFLTGGGGVGKSYILNHLRQELPITVTATTGVAALNVNGQTIHSWSGIGICNKSVNAVVGIIRNTPKKLKRIQNAKILAIDEISMLDDTQLEYLNEVFKKVRNSAKVFGGLQVLFIGDFFQLPPVDLDKVDPKTEKTKSYCFQSPIWEKLKLKTIYLKEVYRQDDKQLIESLNNIREGIVTESSIALFMNRDNIQPPEKAVRLYSLNKMVDSYNLKKYNEINEKEYTYIANDCLYDHTKYGVYRYDPWNDDITIEQTMLRDLYDKNTRITRTLNLKPKCRVMLLQNIDVKQGLVNGSCGTVICCDDESVTVKFDNGMSYVVGTYVNEYYQDGQLMYTREQIPLALAYACSIHKSQGLTLDNVFIEFEHMFAPGQAYVALSRAKTLDGMFLSHFNSEKIKADKRIKDFYKQFEK